MELTRAELSILLTGDSEIRALNARFRDLDEATDVLSFPQSDQPPSGADWAGVLGDVVISLETASRQAGDGHHQARLDQAGWTDADEVLFLLVHGVLHLVGFDHRDADEEADMRAEERRLFEHVRGQRADS